MSLIGLLNESISIYRYTKGVTQPYDDTGTWALVTTLPCYVSDSTITRVNEDGAIIEKRITRFRIEPYTTQKGDEIYFDSKMWEILTNENFDRLGMEGVIRAQEKKTTAAKIAAIIA